MQNVEIFRIHQNCDWLAKMAKSAPNEVAVIHQQHMTPMTEKRPYMEPFL